MQLEIGFRYTHKQSCKIENLQDSEEQAAMQTQDEEKIPLNSQASTYKMIL
jgi:hypothetical protein